MQNSTNNQNYTGPDEEPRESLKGKKGVFARFRSFLFDKKETKDPKKSDKPRRDVTTESGALEKFNEFMGTIETQLDRVDEQNKSLLQQVSVLKANNETLISQIKILTDNNSLLTEQFNASKKREKIAKILAIIASTLAIGVGLYNLLRLIIGW